MLPWLLPQRPHIFICTTRHNHIPIPFSSCSASTAVVRATKLQLVVPQAQHSSTVQSWSTGKPITLSPSPVNTSASSSIFVVPAKSTHLKDCLHMVPTHAPSVVTLTMPLATVHRTDLRDTLYIHTSPYAADSWLAVLEFCSLSDEFPYLVQDIRFGSPIGNPPPLFATFLPPNLPLANFYPHIIDQEIL